jgi:hypothetical protein
MPRTKEELPGDASTLIYLAKADVFEAAAACVSTILVPPSVWTEAVAAGERFEYPDVPRIRDALDAGWLRRIELTDEQQALAGTIASEHRIGLGESEVLAAGRSSGRAIVDEGRATRAARSLGIVPISTLFLPVLGHLGGGLDEADALSLLRRLAVVTGARAETVFAIEAHLGKEQP